MTVNLNSTFSGYSFHELGIWSNSSSPPHTSTYIPQWNGNGVIVVTSGDTRQPCVWLLNTQWNEQSLLFFFLVFSSRTTPFPFTVNYWTRALVIRRLEPLCMSLHCLLAASIPDEIPFQMWSSDNSLTDWRMTIYKGESVCQSLALLVFISTFPSLSTLGDHRTVTCDLLLAVQCFGFSPSARRRNQWTMTITNPLFPY